MNNEIKEIIMARQPVIFTIATVCSNVKEDRKSEISDKYFVVFPPHLLF